MTHFIFDLAATDLAARSWRMMERFADEVAPESPPGRLARTRSPERHEQHARAAVAGFISDGRVGRLGTADATGQPLVVPFCYAWDGAALFSAIDAKPKRAAGGELKRIRNIAANPKVSCRHRRATTRTGAGCATSSSRAGRELLTGGAGVPRAAPTSCSTKYPQYRAMGLPPRARAS